MLIVTGKSRLEKVLRDLWSEAVSRVEGELKGIKTLHDLADKVKALRGEVEKLELEKSRREEEIAKKEREIEHKIGLERKRQEFELASAKREATLSVREENLAADRKRFEEQMTFHDERFTAEVGYLKEMLADVVKRLPTLDMTADVSPRSPRKR